MTAYPSRTHEFYPCFYLVAWPIDFCVVFCGFIICLLFVFFLLLVVLSIFRLTFLVSSLVSWKFSYTSSTCTRLDEIFSTNTVISYCTNPLKRSLCIKSSDDTKNILNLPLDEGTKAGFVTRVPRWVPQVEEELLTLRGPPSSPLPPPRLFVRLLVFCILFACDCFSCWALTFVHYIVCPSSIFSFDCPFGILDLWLWLPLWYLRFTTSDYRFGILDLRLWLPLWYLRFTALIAPLVS